MPDDVPLSRVLDALERAARHRRSLATGPGVNAVTLANDIIGVPAPSPIRVNRHGWANVGTVCDGFAGACILAVWWHRETDRVKIERPREYVPPPPPSRALYPTRPPMGGTNHTSFPPFIALPGFVFTFEGADYTPEATERLTAEQGSIAGWTWRRDPNAAVRS